MYLGGALLRPTPAMRRLGITRTAKNVRAERNTRLISNELGPSKVPDNDNLARARPYIWTETATATCVPYDHRNSSYLGMLRRLSCWLLIVLGMATTATGQTSIFREALPTETHIAWHHENGRSNRHYLPEMAGAGVAIFDYDNDGWMDILLVTRAQRISTVPPTIFIWRSTGTTTTEPTPVLS